MSVRSAVTRLVVLILAACLAAGTSQPTVATADDPEPTYRCMTDTGAPCRTAKQYKRAFKAGELGQTTASKGDFSKRFKKKMRRAAVRQELIPPPSKAARAAAGAKYKYGSWGDLWDAFTEALDCVAPGAESACREDISKVKRLKKPTKIVLGCGGIAVMSYYTAGTATPAIAAISGGSLCTWGMAIDAW